jgi:hypothetical protein
MRSIAAALILVGAMAAPLSAQGRGSWSQGRIPPGQMPPAGSCRVWYDGVPPGQQPPPMSCRDAERIASRSRDARVIYGDQGRYDRGRYDNRYPGRYEPRSPYGNTRYGAMTVPYQNGYRDGLEKGREDAGDRDSFDPVRHSRYRNADHGYNSRYGSKEQYRLVYRDGFEAGYREAYGNARTDRRYGSGIRIP